MAVVTPSFSEWQASRGIVPWDAKEAIRSAVSVVTDMWAAVVDAFRPLVASVADGFQAAVEQINAFGVSLARAYQRSWGLVLGFGVDVPRETSPRVIHRGRHYLVTTRRALS